LRVPFFLGILRALKGWAAVVNTQAAFQIATSRWQGGRVALFALLALFTTGASSPSGMTTCIRADLALAPPSTADNHAQLERPSTRADRCADATIDASEDDDSGRGGPNSLCPQRTETVLIASSPITRPVNDLLARSYLARGPPSA